MIIAICGLQGSGKDTLGSFLIKNYGFTKLSFAGILKDVVSILFNWNRDLLEGSTKESREWREKIDNWWSEKLNIPNLTPRWVLQNIGTNVFRDHFHQDIWVKALERQLFKYDRVIITDCRFSNEYEMLKNQNANIIKIVRDEPDWFKNYIYNSIEPVDIHKSEYIWANFKFDYVINNCGTLNDLEKESKIIYDKFYDNLSKTI
jgi:hypothetical protein